MNDDELLGKIVKLREEVWKTEETLLSAKQELALLNLEYRRRLLNENIKQEVYNVL